MQINIREDSVEIEGYVNAIERKSKPLWSRIGRFVERVCKGAFQKALDRNDNVRILLNHNWDRDLGGQRDGNLELYEDSIGLHARATITDADVIDKAREGKLVGWSFGFADKDVENKRDENGYPLRDIRDLELYEVSILDNTASPAYEGTLVSVRAESDESIYFGETFTDEIKLEMNVREEPKETEEVPKQQETVETKDKRYDEFKKLVEDMKN